MNTHTGSIDAGTKIGPCEVQSQLRRGGMGMVYRARDTRLDRDVAIKVLPESITRDMERVLRFEHEAKVLAAPAFAPLTTSACSRTVR